MKSSVADKALRGCCSWLSLLCACGAHEYPHGQQPQPSSEDFAPFVQAEEPESHDLMLLRGWVPWSGESTPAM